MTVTERMRLAVAAFSRGDLTRARQEGEAALRIQPHSPAALQLLGVVCCRAGDARRGVDYLRDAMARGGDMPDLRLNLARALFELGELQEAEGVCDLSSGPSLSRDLQRMHADILKAQGRHLEAISTYERLVATKPDDFESWNNLGNARHETGDLEGALGALQHARALQPKSSLVHTNIGRVLTSMDRYEDACLILEKAALLAPKDSAPLLELGRILTSIDHPAAALRALGTAARLNSRDPRIFVAIGLAFSDLYNPQQAERSYCFAIQADPAFAAGYLNLGILLEKANRVDELDALIARARAARVEGDEIDFLRALSLSRKGEHEEALALARSLRSASIHPATRAQFIGQLADRLGRIDEAFAAFEDMNQTMAQSPLGLGVDRSAYRHGIDGLKARTTAAWFASWPAATVAANPPAPVFLVGFPRSGTTLLDTVLMGHGSTHVLEEIPIIETISQKLGDFSRVGEIGGSEVADLRALYFEEPEKASPAPPGKLVIDKNPLSMIRMPLIHRLFPDAKIILTLRHPCDVVLSCYMQNFKVTEAMSSFLDLDNASRTYDRIFDYWEHCRGIFPLRVHDLRYESMIANLEEEVRPLLDFLELPWDDRILDHQRTAVDRGFIRTPSYAQVTERLYDRARGRWERYRPHMRNSLPILAPWVERLGYGVLPPEDL